MTRILVTGATGFIGSHALAPLRRRGFEVHVLGRHPPADPDVVFHQTDLFDAQEVERSMRAAEATHLLHLAWYAEPGHYWRSPKNLDWVAASLRLVQLFAAHGGVRAVFAGTCAEYEWGAERFGEFTTPCLPATLYGTAKDALRRLVGAYGEAASLSTAWGRVFFLYGPGEKSGRLISDAILALLKGTPFPTSHGRQRRDFLHVDDVAGAFAALAASDVSGPVNIASGNAVSIRSILERVAVETGNAHLLQFGARHLAETEPATIEADIRRLRDEVGFASGLMLEEGLLATVEWWRSAPAM